MGGPRFDAQAARIEGFGRAGWIVAGAPHAPALLVTSETAASLPGLVLDTLDAASLPELPGIDLLLLGTGDGLKRPPPAFARALAARGLRVEAMDSRAAARTFNVLVAEERPVAALIL
jgi:uncharacterized protein